MAAVEIEIFWTNRAKSDLQKIYDFNTEVKGEEKAWELVVGMEEYIKASLSKRIDGGIVDHQFQHLGNKYFKLLYLDHKITFRRKGHIKYVIRIFDLRQHPDKNL